MSDSEIIRNSDLDYVTITDEEVYELHDSFIKIFEQFLTDFGCPSDTNYTVNSYSLIDAIIRVDKRIAYFWCFHDMEINERKEAALYVYWFLKFRPFNIMDNRFLDDNFSSKVNEYFAIYLICSVLFFDDKAFSKIVYTKEKKTNILFRKNYCILCVIVALL